MFNLFKCVRINIAEIGNIIKTWVVLRHRDNFVIHITRINHVHESDRTRPYQNSRQERVSGQEHNIKSVFVIPKGTRYETVVKGKVLCGMGDTVESNQASFLVYLILVLRTLV